MIFQIAIDGPSGVGKSSTARKLAERLNFQYINTGLFFRGLAFVYQQERKKNPQISVDQMMLKLKKNRSFQAINNEIFYHKKKINAHLIEPTITKLSSLLSQNSNVRDYVLSLEREIASKNNVVMEGRDIGTIVLPKAILKIFLTASVEIRAQRRYEELNKINHGSALDLEIIKQKIINRDLADQTRNLAPLIKAKDAIEIVSDHLNLEAVILKIEQLFLERIKNLDL
ncbi:CMP/dCMP kinase [[Mycoplasma] cavipharyngis]|uniref:(d)CMP kinase n=1 Tax=[Mycoplasma] cavipharyngis TaxID=92757 RepID=UPI00370395DB